MRLIAWTPELGRRLRAARAYNDLSQPDLGQHFGWSRSTVVRIENGDRALKDYELARIAAVCEVPIEFFTLNWDALVEAASRQALDGLTAAAGPEEPGAETRRAPERKQRRQDGRQG